MTRYKISFVGDANVGKTSIVTRYVRDTFGEHILPTVGVANFDTSVEVNGHEVDLNIWDTAGQERFRSLVPVYLRGANLIVLVFDISDLDSFNGLSEWKSSIDDIKEDRCPVIVVANKMDLDKEVQIQDVKRWASDNGLNVCFVSAKTGLNVKELFQDIGAEARESYNKKDSTRRVRNEEEGCC